MAEADLSPDEIIIYEKLYELMGAKVQLGCSSEREDYVGIVGNILPQMRQVSLKKASFLNGEPVGNLRFRFKEISYVTQIESKEVVSSRTNDYLLNILRNSGREKYDIYEDALYEETYSDESDNEKSVEEEVAEQEFTLEVPDHLKNQLPKDSLVLDCLDVNFREAIHAIFQHSVIGVSFEGQEVSRFAKLTSLCIATASHVYLFDMDSLGDEAFDYGLRDLFEDPSIKKVIHDCRYPSDCLFHQYSTKLNNVFDTQVADFVACMQRYTDKYKFDWVNSLNTSLFSNLKVPYEFLCCRVPGLSEAEKIEYIAKRPISNQLRYDLIKNALYLIPLQKKLEKEMLGPVHKIVSAYQSVIARASDAEINTVGDEVSPPDALPPCVLMNGIQKVRFQEPGESPSISLRCDFFDPTTGQIIKHEPEVTSDSERFVTFDSIKKKEEEEKQNCLLQMKRELQKKSASRKINSGDLMIDSETLSSLIMKPSGREIDEIYHRLANSRNDCSSVVMAKPASHYVSRFTVRKPFSYCENIPVDTTPDVDVNAPEYKAFWASLAVPSDSTCATSFMKRKISFVPG